MSNENPYEGGYVSMWPFIALIVISTIGGITLAGCCIFSAPGYDGSKSDHFDGKRFHNQDAHARRTFLDFLKWMTTRDAPEWYKVAATASPVAPEPRAGEGELAITFVNHSTFLIQTDGLNILTDPIWSERTSPVTFSGPERAHPPGILLEDLPKIDVVVISHNHYDHLDVPTLKHIYERDKPGIYVGLGNKSFLNREGIENVQEMDWWQEDTLSPQVKIVCVPAQHFSGRGLCDRNKTLWAGFVFEGSKGAVYFAGDTGFGPHFKQIAKKFRTIRLAMLPIGAFRPEWFMSASHLSPQQALEAHHILQAQTSMAMHFGTFRLGDDKQNEPVEALRAALADSDMNRTRFLAIFPGETEYISLN